MDQEFHKIESLHMQKQPRTNKMMGGKIQKSADRENNLQVHRRKKYHTHLYIRDNVGIDDDCSVLLGQPMS